ncbi:SHOCT domain-containing protein [Herbidospora mongoliensis]|uniref:SHOCT domain-containing protein n=1 Tax=Herbidospora mongoliensis TaxID=688067 RepID=UPI00082E1093|nr:SHOCT domain-containing protein [Herbidospora mongoliensis]
MPKGARIWIGLSVGLQLIWSLPLAVFMYILWTNDAETAGLTLSIVFGTLSLVIVVALVWMITAWRRTDARERALRENGLRAEAVVTDVVPTGVRINDRLMYRLVGHVAEVPGMELKHSTMWPVPPGTRLTIAYDPARPGSKPLVLDDLKSVAARMRMGPVPPLPTGADAVIQRLTQLDQLRQSGAISDEEFERLKADVIDGR